MTERHPDDDAADDGVVSDDVLPDDADGGGTEELLDRMRGTGVGVEDPNIVGDVGPTDVPPGRDGDGGLLVDGDPDEPR